MIHALLISLLQLLSVGQPKTNFPETRLLLVGNWEVLSAERQGQKLVEDEVRKCKLTFTAEKLTFKQGDKTKEASYTLNSASTPREFDLLANDALGREQTLVGIYQLEKDQLKLCFALKPGTARPTAFATTQDAPYFLLVLKREKP